MPLFLKSIGVFKINFTNFLPRFSSRVFCCSSLNDSFLANLSAIVSQYRYMWERAIYAIHLCSFDTFDHIFSIHKTTTERFTEWRTRVFNYLADKSMYHATVEKLEEELLLPFRHLGIAGAHSKLFGLYLSAIWRSRSCRPRSRRRTYLPISKIDGSSSLYLSLTRLWCSL